MRDEPGGGGVGGGPIGGGGSGGVAATTAAGAATTLAMAANSPNGQRVVDVIRRLWKLPDFARGWAVERILGRSPDLVDNFPVIDRMQGGIATSIKSINIWAKGYQKDPNQILCKVQAYVDELSHFQGTTWAGRTILPSEIRGRVLELAVPEDPSAYHWELFRQLQQYASRLNNPVEIRIITITNGQILITRP